MCDYFVARSLIISTSQTFTSLSRLIKIRAMKDVTNLMSWEIWDFLIYQTLVWNGDIFLSKFTLNQCQSVFQNWGNSFKVFHSIMWIIWHLWYCICVICVGDLLCRVRVYGYTTYAWHACMWFSIKTNCRGPGSVTQHFKFIIIIF